MQQQKDNHMAVTQQGRDTELERLRSDVRQLQHLLQAERQKFCSERQQLQAGLEDTRQQLMKQKSRKVFINQGKGTKRQLETPRYSRDDTPAAFSIAQEVNDTKRQKKMKKRKLLHTDYKKLQEAHIMSSTRLTEELQAAEHRAEVLQVGLNAAQAELLKLRSTHATEKLHAQQQVEELQEELEWQAERESRDQQQIQSLKEDLHHLLHELSVQVQKAELSSRPPEVEHMSWIRRVWLRLGL